MPRKNQTAQQPQAPPKEQAVLKAIVKKMNATEESIREISANASSRINKTEEAIARNHTAQKREIVKVRDQAKKDKSEIRVGIGRELKNVDEAVSNAKMAQKRTLDGIAGEVRNNREILLAHREQIANLKEEMAASDMRHKRNLGSLREQLERDNAEILRRLPPVQSR